MFKKGDFFVFSIITFIAVVLFFAIFGSGGKCVTVTAEGELYGEYPLKKDSKIQIKTQRGVNTLVIEDGEAYFTDSDCPDKTCEKMGKISHNGQSVVCLPHKVIAEVKE